MDKIRIHAVVEGKVQGVSYRASTQIKAASLRLTGWVKNRADGNVELEAQGSPERIMDLIDWAKQGPRFAQVTALNYEPVELNPVEKHFDIVG